MRARPLRRRNVSGCSGWNVTYWFPRTEIGRDLCGSEYRAVRSGCLQVAALGPLAARMQPGKPAEPRACASHQLGQCWGRTASWARLPSGRASRNSFPPAARGRISARAACTGAAGHAAAPLEDAPVLAWRQCASQLGRAGDCWHVEKAEAFVITAAGFRSVGPRAPAPWLLHPAERLLSSSERTTLGHSAPSK